MVALRTLLSTPLLPRFPLPKLLPNEARTIPTFAITEPFQLVTDTVMGGHSSGTLTREMVQGREAYRLRGMVSLENNGGFVQMAADLNTDGSTMDMSAFTGIELDVIDSSLALGHSIGSGPMDQPRSPNRDGNTETYNIHLRTSDLTRPWQSYRQSFIAGSEWETHRIAFTDFAPHRTDTPLNLTKLRRIGILAIGREFEADVSVGGLRFYG